MRTLGTRAAYWQEVCQRFVGTQATRIKVADIGGDGQDASFEQALSNLAHTNLSDKAPSLLDHELGFQLIERNEDTSKAAGVFVFRVGSQTIMAPVFFLQGKLKGHELMYLKDQDMFVPLKENWVDYVLNRKPNILGAGVPRRTSQLGVRQPYLGRLSSSPSKYASAMFPEARDFLPVYSALTAPGMFKRAVADYGEFYNDRLNLESFVKQASLPMLEVMAKMMRQRPVIAQAYDRWYGLDSFRDAIKSAGERMRIRSILDTPPPLTHQGELYRGSLLDLEKRSAKDDDGPDAKNKIKIITYDSSTQKMPPPDLTEDEQENLLRDGMLIKDHRNGEEVSVAVRMQAEQRLTNPHDTGVYMVLTKPGDFEKCLVVTNPHGPDGRKSFCTVVRMDESKRAWANIQRDDLWVAGQVEELMLDGEEGWQEFYDGLTDATTLEKGARYMLVGPRRNATLPFYVRKSIGDKGYEVDFSMHCDFRPGFSNSKGLHRYNTTGNDENWDTYEPWRDGQRIHLDAKQGTDLRSSRGDLYVPKGYKVLKLKAAESDKERESSGLLTCCPADSDSSDPAPIMPGRIADAEMAIMQKTAAFKIENKAGLYRVNEQQPRGYWPTKAHLVATHGFSIKTAEILMAAADTQAKRHARPFECRVKYASPFLTAGGGPNAPPMSEPDFGDYNPMGYEGRTQNLHEEEQVVPELMAANTDPSIYNVAPSNMPEPTDVNQVAQAAASGQKEVFDSSMIGSMLRAVRDDTMIDRFVPDIIKGMDRTGRILLMFYWHQDQFADRFGKRDMPELEDALRNSFEMSGDVVLFLKQKTIESSPEETARELDLGDAAEI